MPHEERQAGAIESYKGRGVYVPSGLEASWIMEGAEVLEAQFDIAPYTSRLMVAEVLNRVMPLMRDGETSRLCGAVRQLRSPV